jgi:hypothetical protein
MTPKRTTEPKGRFAKLLESRQRLDAAIEQLRRLRIFDPVLAQVLLDELDFAVDDLHDTTTRVATSVANALSAAERHAYAQHQRNVA